jgi:hypothetical protein
VREVARSVTSAGAAPLVAPRLVSSLQRSAGNQAVARLLRQDGGPVQRDDGVASPALALDQEYRLALQGANQTGDWRDAAEKLNGFNRADIFSRLAQLSDEQVGYLHLGAVGNPRVGPESQVALLTMPGAPRASTEAPGTTPAPATPERSRPRHRRGQACPGRGRDRSRSDRRSAWGRGRRDGHDDGRAASIWAPYSGLRTA